MNPLHNNTDISQITKHAERYSLVTNATAENGSILQGIKGTEQPNPKKKLLLYSDLTANNTPARFSIKNLKEFGKETIKVHVKLMEHEQTLTITRKGKPYQFTIPKISDSSLDAPQEEEKILLEFEFQNEEAGYKLKTEHSNPQKNSESNGNNDSLLINKNEALKTAFKKSNGLTDLINNDALETAELFGALHIPATKNRFLDVISLRNELQSNNGQFKFYDLSGAGSNCWLRAAWSLIFNCVDNKQLDGFIDIINNDKSSSISRELNQAKFDKSEFLRINENAKTDLSSVFDDGILQDNNPLLEVNRQRRLCYRNQDGAINTTADLEEHLQLFTKYILQKISRSDDSNKREYGDGFIDLMLSPTNGAPLKVIFDILKFFNIDYCSLVVNRSLKITDPETWDFRQKQINNDGEKDAGLILEKNTVNQDFIRSLEQNHNSRQDSIKSHISQLPIIIFNTTHFNIAIPVKQ